MSRGSADGRSPARVLVREGASLLAARGSLPIRVLADTSVALTLLNLVLGLWQEAVAVALYALVLLGQTLVRLAPLRPGVQACTAALLLGAAWAAMVDAYQRIGWLDVAMHLLVTGLLAALAVAGLHRAVRSHRHWPETPAGLESSEGSASSEGPASSGEEVLTAAQRGLTPGERATNAVLAAGLGALLAVLWEIGEWFGHTLVDPAIQVGYEDTIGDLAAGVLGAALAGAFLDRLLTRGWWR